MTSSVSIHQLQSPLRPHLRPAGIRSDCRQQFPATAHVRLARREEVPHVLTLIQDQAEYHGGREKCKATVADLEAGLFDSPYCSQPQFFLHGPSVLLLELSPSSFDYSHSHGPSLDGAATVEAEETASWRPAPYPARKSDRSSNGHARVAAENHATDSTKELVASLRDGHGVAHKFMIPELIKDPHALAFRSTEGRIIAGFAMIFKKYNSYQAKYGIYVEDLYVREGMRGYGFGTVLFRSVARLAMELDCCAVEFRVVDWNKKALKLYESLGVKVSPEWQSCSLSGDSLDACGSPAAIFADLGKSRKAATPKTLQPIAA